jgi:hypothetical protein
LPRGLKLFLRRSARFASASLLVVAIAAYAAFLLTAHDATKSAMLDRRDEQLLGSAANGGTNILVDRVQGTIELGRLHATSAEADWRLGPIETHLASDTSIRSEEIFVTGLAFALATPASVATVFLDGRPIQELRPASASAPGHGPFAVGNVALQPIDISPGYEMGFRFPVPADGACVTRECTVTIHMSRSVWVIHRIGVLFSTQTSRPALWPTPTAPWKIFGIAVLLALASHLALSIRVPQQATRATKEWKPI